MPPPGPSTAGSLPPALHHLWSGAPRATLEDTGAFLLPRLLPLRPSDRILVAGPSAQPLAGLLDDRLIPDRPPLAVSFGPHEGAPRVDPHALPFPNDAFTVVVCPHQFRRWDDDTLLAFLRESWRVLTHNGLFVAWEVAPSRSHRVNAIWRRLLARPGAHFQLRTFAQAGRLGREAGFAWIQTLALRPFLWPPGPRLSLLMRKEAYDERTIQLAEGETPPPRP